jgi:hypothetical protein
MDGASSRYAKPRRPRVPISLIPVLGGCWQVRTGSTEPTPPSGMRRCRGGRDSARDNAASGKTVKIPVRVFTAQTH